MRKPKCPRCFEPAPCLRCVEVEQDQAETSFGVIVLASVAAAIVIYWTWFGGLFE